jgi:AmmeMemoRadiSam system protein B
LIKQVETCFLEGPGEVPETPVTNQGSRNIIGLICPHAGYMFSGSVAAFAYYQLALDGKPGTIILFGPNHTGYGSALAVMKEGVWSTPLGDVEIDDEIAGQLVHESKILDVDALAHQYEHSIEVQLPFLQYLYHSNFKIVPISFMMQDLASAREVGQTVAKVVKDRDVVIIASSDMTHYEQQEVAERKDRNALQALMKFDEEEFNAVIEVQNVSACGYGPITALMAASEMLKAKKAELLCYRTSGDVTGDYSSVVGYASVRFTR